VSLLSLAHFYASDANCFYQSRRSGWTWGRSFQIDFGWPRAFRCGRAPRPSAANTLSATFGRFNSTAVNDSGYNCG